MAMQVQALCEASSIKKVHQTKIGYVSFLASTALLTGSGWRRDKHLKLLNMVYVSAQSELYSETHRPHPDCNSSSDDLSLENACPLTARRCRELLLEGGGQADCQHSEENWLGYPGNPFMVRWIFED